MKKTLALILCAVFVAFAFISCGENTSDGEQPAAATLWDSAMYKEDAAVGEGEITFTLAIEAEGKTVVLTVSTNESVLGNALYNYSLINDPSFFDTANGMKASWDEDQAWWAFYVGDTMASYGVSDEVVSRGNSYKLVYTK